MLRRITHDVKDLLDELDWDAGVEQVAHGVHEDEARLAPAVRNPERVGVQGEREAWAARAGIAIVLVLARSHRLQALGERERVAVVATKRGLVAASRWVPRGFGPLD